MATINDIIDNLEDFQDIQFQTAMDITNDLQTKQLTALENINNSLIDLKNNMSSSSGGNSGSFFDDLLRRVFGDGTGSGGNSGGRGFGGILGILGAGLSLVFEGAKLAFEGIKKTGQVLWDYGKAGVGKAIDVAKNLASGIATGLKNIVSTMVNTISSGVKSLVNMGINSFKELVIQPMLEGAEIYIDTTNQIRKEVGWQKSDYEQFAGSMSRMVGELGNKVGASDILKKAHEVVQLGIKDEEAVSAYTKTLMKMQLALDIDASGMKNLLELTKRLGTQGAQAIEKLGKSIRALDDANLVKALGNKDLMAFAEKMSDVFGGNAEEGSEEWLKENQWAMSGYNALANIDPNLAKGLGDFMTKVANARNDELGDLSVQFGMNMSSVRDAIDRGDIQSVMNSYLAGVNEYIAGGLWNNTKEAKSGYADIFSRSQARRMQRLMEEGKFDVLQLSQKIEEGYLVQRAGVNAVDKEGKDNLEQHISGLNVGLVKEMQNANSALGIHYGEILRDTGANAKDVNWAISKLTEMVTLGFDMVEKLVGSVISGVKGVFDVLVPAPVQTALAIAGVMYIGYRIFGDYLMKAAKGITNYITDAIIGLGNFMLDALPGAMQLAMDVFVGTFNFIIDSLPGMFNLLKDAIIGLGKYIIDSLPGVFNLTVDALSGLGSYLIDAIKGVGNFIVDALPGTLYFLKDVIFGLGYFIKDFALSGILYIKDALGGILHYLVDLLPGLVDYVITAGGQLIHWLWDSLSNILPTIAISLVKTIGEEIFYLGETIVTVVKEGLPLLGELVVEALKSLGTYVWEGLQISGKFIGSWIEYGADLLINKGKEILIEGLEFIAGVFDSFTDKLIDILNLIPGINIEKENPEEREKRRHESLMETFGVKNSDELKPPSFDDWELPSFEKVFDSNAYSDIKKGFIDLNHKTLDSYSKRFTEPLDTLGEGLERAVNDIPDIGEYVTADFFEHAGKYLKRDANGNVMQITDYIGEGTNGSLTDYFDRQSEGKNPIDYLNEQTKGRGIKDYVSEHGGNTNVISYIDQQTGGKNVFDYLKENVGDLSNYLTANGNIMDYLNDSIGDLNSYLNTNGTILDYISEKLKGSPMDYLTANGTPLDYINRQTGGRGINDYIPEMDKQQVMANMKELLGDIGGFVQEGLGESLKLIGVEHGDEIAKQGIDFMKNLFDKATAGASQLMESGQNLLSQVDLNKLLNSAGDIGSLLTNTLSSGLSPLAGGLESLLSNFQNFNQASGVFQRDELSASKSTAHSVADIAKSLNPNYSPPAYEEGTPLVGSGQTFDSNAQVAVLHEGEAVVPADKNPYNNPSANIRDMIDRRDIEGVTREYQNAIRERGISGDFPRSQLKQLQRFISQGEVKGSSGNPLDREAIKDVEGAVRTTTELEIQNANLNADRDSQLQEVQINQGKKNEEQHNLEIKQGIELIEQGESMIKQGEEDKVIQENHKSLLEKVVENQKSFIDLFKEYHSNWKADRDSDNKFYMDTLNNLMGIHNNTGGIAMILMQTGGNRVGTSQGNRLISTGNVTPLSAPSGNASLDQKADYVYSELIRNGFSKDVAAGIVGNLMNENLAEHDQSHADYYGDGSYAGMGGGMAAWLNERFTGLQDFAKSQGKDWRDLGVQTQFLLKELDNMPNLKQQLLNGNLSVNDAAELFMREFEKPAAEYAHLDRRQSSAQAVRQRDNGAIGGIGGIGSISSGGGDISLPVSTGQQGLIPVSTNQTISPTFQGSIPNYKQYENGQGGKWDASAWGDLQASGCAPTALAIQAQAVTGKTITPADVANWGASAGFRDDKSGLIMQGAKQFGYGVQKIDHATLDSSGSALEALKKGIPVVMGIGAGQLNGLGGQSGHYFTATGIDENGHIKINDPGSNDEYIRQNFSNFTWEDIVAASPDMYVPTLVNMNGQGNIPSVSTPVNQQAVAGGNIMKMIAQVGKDCTKEAWAAITNAYLGTNYTSGDISFDTWASDLEGGQLQAQFHDYSQEDRASFEQQIQSHFSANPNKPIYLYQAGGDGSYGSHKLNRGSGTHATVIGRQLENGKYQVFDSNGGVTHELDLSEIWDSSARGGSGISGNALWIPQISPTKSITGWETSNGQAPGSTGQQGGIPQPMQNGQHLNLNGFQPSFAGQSTFSGISSANFSPANVTGGGSDYQSQVVSLLRGIARALGVDTRAITGAIVQSSNNQGNQLVNAINENGVGGRQVIATGNNPNTNPQNSNFQQGNGVLTGNTNEEKIWGFLKAKGLTDEQVAGIMGNLQQESGFDPTIIEGGGHADSATGASFTQGYGIAQWTFERKDDLENFAKSLGKSSGDLGVQLEFLWHELNNSESEALQALKGATDVATATDLFHRKFERSADAVSDTRIGYGQDIYNKLKGKSFTASNPQQQNINQANQPTQQGQQAIDQANRNNQNTQRQGSQSRQLDEQLVAKLMKDTGLTSKGLNNAVEYIDKVLKRSYSKMGSNGIEISETDIKDIMDTQGKTKEQALEILKKDDKYLKFSEDMLKQTVYSSGEKMDESHIRTLTALGFTFKEAVDTLKLAKGEQINSGQQVEELIKGTGLSKEFLEKNVQNIIKANNRDLRLLGENGIEISDNDLKYALSLDWIKGDMDKALAFLKSDAKYNEITNEMIKNLTTKDGKHLKIEDLKSLTKMGYTLKEAVDILDNPEELKKLQDKEAGKGNSVAELANSGKGSNIPERNSSPFRVDSEALIQKYMMRDRMVFGSFGQTLADRKGLGEWIVKNKGELPPGYRQWSNPLSRAGMPHLLYGQIQPGVIPTNTNRQIRDTTTNGIDTRYTSNVYRPNISYNALKSNFKSGIDKVLTVELGYKSVRDLQEASKDLRISSKNLDKSTNNMDDALTDISAPSGQKYTKNDLDYLLNNGYTKEQALDLLSKDIKYMKLDLSKFEKSKNNKEFDQEDVRDLLLKNRDNKEYTIDKAIEELSKTDKYSKPLEDLAKLEKEIKERISSGESKDDELGKIIGEIKKANANELRQLSVKYGIDTKAIKESIEKASGKEDKQTTNEDTLENRNKLLKEVVDKLSPRELAMKYGLTREEIEALQIKYKGKSEIPGDFIDPIGNKVRQITSSARISKTGELLVRPQDYHMTLTSGQRRQLQSEIASFREWEAKQVQEKASKFTEGEVSYEDYMKTRLERLSKSRQGIPFQVGLDNQSLQSLDKASKRIKESSDSMNESAIKIEEGSGKMSEASIEISKNDFDYLTKVKGFSEEQALEMLNKDAKYMKIDTSSLEKSINKREFDSADIRKLLVEHREDRDYNIDKAIQELNQTAKYSKSLEDINKLNKDLKDRITSGENKDDELGKIVQEIKTTKASDLSNLSLKYGIDTSELESLKKSITSTASRDTNQGNVNLTRDNRGVFYSNGIPVSTPPFISSNVQSRLPYGMQLGDLTVGGGIGGAIGQGLPRSRTTVFGGGFSSQYQQGNLAQTLSPFRTLIQTFFGRDYKKGNEDFATGAQNYRDAIWSGNNFEGNIYSDLKSGVDWLNILFNTGTGSIGRKKVNDILTSTGGVGTHAYQFDQNSFAGMFVGGFNRRQAEKDNSLYLTPGQDNVISYYPSSQLMTGYNYSQQQIPYVQHQQIDYRYSTNQSYQQMKPIEGTYEYYMDKASRAKKKEDMSIFDKLGAHSQEYWLKKAQEAKLSGNVMNIENISKQTSKSVKTSKTEIKEQQIQKEKKYDQNDIAYLRQFNWIKSDEDAKKYLDNNSWKYKDIEWSKYGITQKDNKLFTSDNKEINELELRKTLDLKEINGDMTKALEYLSEQAKKAGDELSNTGDKVEDVNKQLDKTNPYEGSGINMDFNTWKGGEYFNDKYAVSNKTREFMEERISSGDLMKSLGIKNTSDILTAEQQQALGFREFNKIRTFKDFEVDSALWKQGKKTDTAVEDWLKAHPEAQVKRKDLERVLEDKSNKLDKFEKEENKEKVLEQTDKGFKPEFDELGNIINLDIPEYNIVTKEDDLLVTQAKWDAQNKQMIDYMVGLSKDIERKEIKDKSKEEILDKDINLLYKDKFERIEGDLSKINPDTFKEERDKLGNITNLPGLLKDNVITGQETLLVQEAKRQAQDKEKEKILSDLRGLNDKNVDKTIKEIQKIKTNSEISGLDKFKENTLEKVKEKHIDISEQAQKELRGRHERIVPSQNTIVSSRTQESYREFLDRTPIGDLTVGGGITGGLSRSKPTLFGGGLLSGLIGGTTSLIAGAGGLISDLLFGGKKSQFKKGTYEYNMEMAMNSKRKEDMNPIDKLFSHSQEYYLDKIKSSSISKEEKTITPNKSEIKKNQEIITFGKDKQYKKEHIDYLLSQNWIKDEDEAKKYLDNNSWQYKEVDWTKMGLTQKDNKLFTEDNKEIKEADLRVILDREDIKGDMKKALEYLSSQEKLSQELVDETKTTNSTLEDQIESVPEQTTLNNKEEQLLATKDNIKIDGKTYEDSLKELEGMHDKKYGIDALTGNITGLEIPEELKINQYDSKEVKDVKFSKQQELMQKEVSLDIQELDNKYESQAEMLNYLNKNPELQKSIQEAIDKGITPDTLPEFDNNGNIINIPGILKDNIYNPEMDDLSVRDSKFKAQNQQYAEILEGIRTKQSVELIRQQDDKERNIQDISNKTNITEENQINNGRVKLEKNIEESKAIISDRAESIVIPKDNQQLEIPQNQTKEFEKGTYEYFMEKVSDAPEKGDFFNHSKQYWLDKANEAKLQEKQKHLVEEKPVIDNRAEFLELNNKDIIEESLEDRTNIDKIEGISIEKEIKPNKFIDTKIDLEKSKPIIEPKSTVPSVLPISDKKEEILPVREIKDIFPEEIVPPAIEEVQQPLPESIPLETPTQKIGEDALQNRQKFRQFLKEGSSEEILDYMQNNMNDGTVNSFLLASNTAREIEMSLRDKGASEDDLAKFEWIKNKRDYNQYGGNWDKEITDDKYKWNTYEASLEGGVLSKEEERQLREDIKVNGGYSEKFDLSTQEGTTKYREAQILFNNYDYSTGKFDEKGIKVARQEHEKQLEELNQLRETKTLDESLGNEPESAVLGESIVIPSPLEEKNSESQLAKIEEVKPLEEIKEASFMNRPKIDINDSDSQLARIEELTGSKLSDKMRENFLNQTPEQRAKILDLYEKRGKLPSIGNGIIKIKDDKQEIIESDKVEKNQEEEKSIQDKLENKIELPNNSKLDKLGKTGEFIEKSAKDEISKYDIEGDTAKMTKEQEQEMLDNLAKESNLETIISSTQEEMINPKKGTYEYYMKKAEETPDKANMGFLGTGLFGEHSKEYWLKKAEKAKVDEVPIQENILLKGMEKVDSGTIAEDTTQINKEVEENIKESSGITKDDIKIEGKTYEESLVDLNKKLDSRYGIDALTGNLTGFDIPEEYKLTGQESEKEKSIKIEKQNELMVKDQELAYKELEDKYTGQAGMLEMINNNSELAKSIEEAEKAGINPDTFVPEFDNNGNITNLPGMLKDNIYNPEADDLGVREAKFKAQNNQYAEILEGIKTKKSTELMDKSGNEKPLSEESKESSVRPNNSQENAVMSPRGIPYEQNDIDYLLNNGYTPEMAYELLSKHPKYMEIDMTQIPKAPNGEEFSEDDIRSLLIEGYELEDAINLLSKNKEYSLDGVSKQEQATQDIGQVSQTTETNMEEFQSVSIQNTSGTAESGEISETINPSSETSSQSTVMDVGNIATQAESARTQATQMTSSDISSSSSNADMVKWAVSRIEAKLDGVISAIQNSGGNKSVTNNFSNQSNFVPQDNDIVLKPTADSNFSV